MLFQQAIFKSSSSLIYLPGAVLHGAITTLIPTARLKQSSYIVFFSPLFGWHYSLY